MKRAMAGAHDLLRRILLLGSLVASVVFLMAPAARADEASAAVAEATGAAVAEQAQPVNVNVSVRVDSPGENGAVAQVDSAGASAAGAVSATASSAQAAPANVNVAVRVGSAGDDGPVTQTNTSAAAAAGGQAAAAGTVASTDGGASTPAASVAHDTASTPAASAAPGAPSPASHEDAAPSPPHESQPADSTPAAGVSADSVTAAGASAAADRASAPASASPGTASTPAATASPGAAGAPGVPDTWTWVWNWTGACANAPAAAPRAGWNWVWNWTCSDDPPAAVAMPPPSAPSGGDAPGVYDVTAIAMVDVPATPAGAPIAAARARPSHARSSTGGTVSGSPPLARRPARGAVEAQQLFGSLTPSGVTHPPAPRVHPSSPATRAKPMRERGRRGGADRRGSHGPFDPDPISPLTVATSGGGGGTGFVLLLTLGLMAAVSLLDPAGWSTRVATAARSGLDRIVRRIDRPG
jgi:hypothetical protein